MADFLNQRMGGGNTEEKGRDAEALEAVSKGWSFAKYNSLLPTSTSNKYNGLLPTATSNKYNGLLPTSTSNKYWLSIV